jgi:hypothetical protein
MCPFAHVTPPGKKSPLWSSTVRGESTGSCNKIERRIYQTLTESYETFCQSMQYWDRRQGEWVTIMSTKATAILVAVLTSLSALSACGGGEPTQVNAGSTRASADAGPTIGEPTSAQERGSVARAGDAAAGARRGHRPTSERNKAARRDRGNRAREITLEIGGDVGTRFSGGCSVGGEEKAIGGRAPARYVYEPDGGQLECEIRKRGTGTLEVVLAAGGNVRSVQRTSAPGGTMKFAYSGSSISSSTFDSSRWRSGEIE